MSAPGKFDYSTSGPDRSSYRSNLAAQMERSSSFRETMEQPVLSSRPNMLRSTSPIAQTDVLNFFQCLRFDPKVVAADHRSIRQGDFKRHVDIALGISTCGDESSSGTLKGKVMPSPIPEEIKRLKAGVRENLVKARERVKIFHEASSVFNKCFPSVPIKKRSRPEGFSNERLSERSVLGSGQGKSGIQCQNMTDGFELEQQMSEEKPRGVVTNKRTRTSMVDVRKNAIVRQSTIVNRDKETIKLGNGNAVQGEEGTSSISDGWEKSKMKKKRSGIKADAYPSLASSKAADGYREMRPGMQLKSAGDSNMTRQGVSNGAAGLGRTDNISQQTCLAARSSVPRGDSDHNPPSNEKKERPFDSEKERANFKVVNKLNVYDEPISASPTSSTKTKASVRGPRLDSAPSPKLSLVGHKTSPVDWDISSCSSMQPTSSSQRKRTISKRSPSRPVTHWAGQRPQKIPRTARRINLGPVPSNTDGSPSADSIADIDVSELGFGFPKRSPTPSPQQVKLKHENSLSTVAFSESEESGPPEIKFEDKAKQFDEVDQKARQSVQKVSIPALSSRKNNKFVTGEEFRDGVRRQGRTGRGFASARSPMPIGVDKPNNIVTAKQVHCAKPSFDKTGRAGRPPTRKLSDRKDYKRQKHTAMQASPDFHVGSNDGNEELMAAVTAVINFVRKFSSPSWRQMDPFFRFISNADIAFFKQQVDLAAKVLASAGISSNIDNCAEELRSSSEDSKAIPLYKRLLAALISEDSSVDEEFGSITGFDAKSDYNGLNHMVELDGYMTTQNLEVDDLEDDVLVVNNLNHYFNGGFSDEYSRNCSDLKYDKLGMDEKLYLEAQSIGIVIEPVPGISDVEDDEISNDIKKLEVELHDTASRKKGIMDRLLKRVLEAKDLQEKEFDHLCYDKLVAMAYEKYKANRRHHSAGSKSSSNKLPNQAALAFVKRTLERCRQYEHTGNSCFNEPVFRNMFASELAQAIDASTDSDLTQPTGLANSRPCSSLTLRMNQNGDSYANSSELPPPENLPLEQQRVKKRELLLDDVGNVKPLSTNTKGKRSERDRDGKGQASSRNKIGRPALSNTKCERKLKAKPNKQKTTKVSSSSVKNSEQRGSLLPRSNGTAAPNSNARDSNGLDETKPLDDLSQLQIPDGLGGPEDFDTQTQDLGSWLNIDDDALQDTDDLMGLQIPMDDLSDLNMMV